MKKALLTAAKWLGVTAFWLVVWFLAARLVGNTLLLPSPVATLKRLGELAQGGELYRAVGASLIRIITGFAGGMLLGCLLGTITAASRLLRELMRPLMTIIKSTPVASFIILALVLIPTGAVPGFTAMLMVTPVFWSNVYTGLLSTDRQLLEMAQVFRFGRIKRVTAVYLPSVEPYLLSALTSGIGLAWKAGIAAEVICVTRDSIGKGLFESKIYLETETMFAWTAVVIVLSLILENLVVWLINRAVRRKKSRRAAPQSAVENGVSR